MTGQLHKDAVVVDCHNDWILMVASKLAHGDATHFSAYWIPEFRAGGVDVQVTPIYIEREYFPEGALRRTMYLVELLLRTVDAHSDDVALCRTGAEIDDAVAAGKVAIVMAFEGSDGIGQTVELVETFFRLGMRMMSFTHFGRSLFADGSAEDDAGSRLTRAAVEAVGEMERLGIVVDVSHLGIGGTEHVLEIATRPLIASHSGVRALADHHRNLGDELIKGIAATGGVMGINFYPRFIDAQNATLDRAVDHIEGMAERVGIDHVGIGPDFIQEYFKEMYANYPDFTLEGLRIDTAIDGLTYLRDLPNLTDAMVKRGFSDDDVTKVLGGNFLRVFREVMGIPK